MSKFYWHEKHPFQLTLLVAIANYKELVNVKRALMVELEDQQESKQVLNVMKKEIPWVSACLVEPV